MLVNQVYTVAAVATTAVATSPAAHGVYISATCSSGLTLTLTDGTTVAVGNATIGTFIPIRCTTATFSAGGVIFLKP